MKRSLMTPEQRLKEVGELASKLGIKIVGTAFAVGCPAIKNPLETMGIEISWASSEPNTVEARLFNQFERALNAVKHAKYMAEYVTEKAYNINKTSYINLNVYGRAMFFDIVEQMDYTRNPSIFLTLAHYTKECLDFDTLGYDQSTKVEKIYKAHVAPKVDPWVAQLAYTAMRLAEYEKVQGEDSSEKFSEAFKPINFNLIQENDNGEIRDETPSSQTVELVADEAYPITDQ